MSQVWQHLGTHAQWCKYGETWCIDLSRPDLASSYWPQSGQVVVVAKRSGATSYQKIGSHLGNTNKGLPVFENKGRATIDTDDNIPLKTGEDREYAKYMDEKYEAEHQRIKVF